MQGPSQSSHFSRRQTDPTQDPLDIHYTYPVQSNRLSVDTRPQAAHSFSFDLLRPNAVTFHRHSCCQMYTTIRSVFLVHVLLMHSQTFPFRHVYHRHFQAFHNFVFNLYFHLIAESFSITYSFCFKIVTLAGFSLQVSI